MKRARSRRTERWQSGAGGEGRGGGVAGSKEASVVSAAAA